MARVYIWDYSESMDYVVSMIKQADSTIEIAELTDEAYWGFWFDTTSTQEQIANACKEAFKDVSIIVCYGRTRVFANYICEDCGTRDDNDHKSSCCTQQTTMPCYCNLDF